MSLCPCGAELGLESLGTRKLYCSKACRKSEAQKRKEARGPRPAPKVRELRIPLCEATVADREAYVAQNAPAADAPRRRGPKPDTALRRAKAEFSTKVRHIVLARDESTCVCCGSAATSVHHIVPLSHGGGNDTDNLISVCGACHSEFHPYLPQKMLDNL